MAEDNAQQKQDQVSVNNKDIEVKQVRPTELKEAPLAIVGMGASAGGLEALEQFFWHMPAENGMAFVVSSTKTRHSPAFCQKSFNVSRRCLWYQSIKMA